MLYIAYIMITSVNKKLEHLSKNLQKVKY